MASSGALGALGVALAWLAARVRVAVGGAVAVCARPVRRGIGAAVAWLARYLLVVPRPVAVRATSSRPLGHGIAWLVRGIGAVLAALVRWLLVVPVVALCVRAGAGRARRPPR